MAVKKTRTCCTSCHTRCGAIVYSEGDKIIRVEGDPDNPLSHGVFCSTGMSQREIHNNTEGRIIYPMRRVGERGSGEWERISWDEALTIMTDKAKELIAEHGPDSVIVGQGTGRTTNHWHCRFDSTIGQEGWGLAPTHVCLMPNILPNAFTTGIFGPGFGDLAHANTMVLWGVNPTYLRGLTAPILDNQEKGAKLVVIDVRFTDLAKNADLFLRPRPGTDGALALGIMNVIIQNGWYDQDWIDKWTYGFDELKARCAEYPVDRVSEITGIDAELIEKAARYMSEGPTAFEIFLGPGCMHTNGIQTGRAIACLTGLLGYIDVPGGVPIDPSFDVMLDDRITLWDSTKDPGRPDLFTFGGEKHPLYKAFGRSNDPHSVFEAIITGEPKPVKMLVLVASDPLLSYENTKLTRDAMSSDNLDLVVIKDFYFSPSTQFADIVLPTADWSERDTWDEEVSEGWIFSVERAVNPPGECWDDWKFFLEWGKRFNEEQWPWKDEREMMLWRWKEFYGLDMTWDEYVAAGYIHPGSQDVQYKKYETGGLRPDGQPGFMTQTGRIEFYCPTMAAFGYDPVPDWEEPKESPISQPELAKEYPFILTTGFRLYSFFHSAWTNIPEQRELYPHPFVLINPKDALKLNVSEGEWVGIESPRGKIKSKARVTHEIGEGVIALPRPGWRDACPELGLPGYGWDQANPNILIPSEPAEPGFGSTPMRSTLCRIVKEEN